jgi:hypothetical protein
LGSHLHFATSDLEKILGRFNSAIQAQKLIVMNETGMSSGEWHRFNGHLKSLITERMVAIERKGLETIRINDYAGYMVTSNQDAPLKIDIGDSRIVCFDVSAHCRDNIGYFDRLGEILDHPDAPGVVMKYLLSRDLSNWSPGKIPITKMKIETMRRQLPNSIRFIIDYIVSWPENCINRFSCEKVYQDYLEWCGCNGEKPLAKKDAGTKFSLINIDRTHLRDNGVRVYQYILDRPKIVAKLRESGLGDMEEFSDIPQDDLPENKTTDIPIFNAPEIIISPKIIPPQPEKSTPSPNTKKDKKADKQDESTQALFDYVVEDALPVASSSKTVEISKVIDPASLRPVVEKKARQQREERLRKWAIDHGEDPDVFMTITEKDVNLSWEYRDRMMADAEVIEFARENKMDPNDLFYMTRRERLISKEIYLREFEDVGKSRKYIYDDEEWQKNVSILQENGMLW